MLQLQAASLSYGSTPVLHGLDLEVPDGGQVCLIGPSGAGKSSLLALLNARLPASGGRVSLFGEDPSVLSPRALRTFRSRIAWIPQDLGLVPNLRVSQNLALGQASRKGFFGSLRSLLLMSKAEKTSLLSLLERVGIAEKLFVRTDHLSGGQQQRVAIARALYQQPDLILADEPVSAVDPARARTLIDLLTQTAREEKAALVMSLHDLTLAREFFPRIIGLREGRIIFDGTPTDRDLTDLYHL